MSHNSEKYFHDMLERALLIQNYTAGRSREDFLNTNWMQDAVHWNLSIIGEALSQLRRIDEPMAAKLQDTQRLSGCETS